MTALEEFQTGLDEVRLLFELRSENFSMHVDGAKDGVHPGRAIARDNALYRSCVVLLVSHFESFLKVLAEDFVDALDTGALESRAIPKGIRELHTVPRLEAILGSRDAIQREALLKKLQSVMSLWNDAAKPSVGTLSGAILSRQVTNAHGETIDALFHLMGHAEAVCDGDIDVPAGDDKEVSANIRFGLKDVVRCRNDIAHGDPTRKPTEADVQRYLDFLATLAKRLQRKHALLVELVG